MIGASQSTYSVKVGRLVLVKGNLPCIDQGKHMKPKPKRTAINLTLTEASTRDGFSTTDRLDGLERRYLGKCARCARAPHILFSLVNVTSFNRKATCSASN